MDLSGLKEKLRSFAPLELLKTLKEFLLALLSNIFSLPKIFPRRVSGGRSTGSFDEESEDRPSFFVRKKRFIVLGFAGLTVVLVSSIIIVTAIRAARPETDLFSVASGLSIPAEEFFFPSEPDFLPGFLPEREPRRFWSLEDIRQYWKNPGNSDWWMEKIESTVDSIMEGVP